MSHLPKLYPISVDQHQGNTLVALRNGIIMEKKQKEEPRVISGGHWDGEAWGIVSIDNDHIITCGDDNLIIMYDCKTKEVVRHGKISDNEMKEEKKAESQANKPKAGTRKQATNFPSSSSRLDYNKMARALTYSKKHNHLVIADAMGKIKIRSLEDFN